MFFVTSDFLARFRPKESVRGWTAAALANRSLRQETEVVTRSPAACSICFTNEGMTCAVQVRPSSLRDRNFSVAFLTDSYFGSSGFQHRPTRVGGCYPG